MKIKEFLKSEISNVEVYAAKKPVYRIGDRIYNYEVDSIICLSNMDHEQNFKSFYKEIILPKIIDDFETMHLKDYSNDDNFNGDIYLDENTKLNSNVIHPQLTSINLVEKENVNYSYIIFKISNVDNVEMLLYLKQTSPIKISSNTFLIEKDKFKLQFNKRGVSVNNQPNYNIDISKVVFINYRDDQYVFDKELYQKHFNLETYFIKKANDIICTNNNIITDCDVVGKANSKLVCEYFDRVDDMFNQHDINNIKTTVENLELGLQITEEGKIILRSSTDVKDLILLATGCLGINSLSNERYRVNKPNNLEV